MGSNLKKDAVSRSDIELLLQTAQKVTSRSRSDLLNRRFPDCVDARSMIFLVLTSWGMSLSGIARHFGLTHPTVIYALGQIRFRLTHEPPTANRYRDFILSIPGEMILRHTWPYMQDLFGNTE